MPDRYDRPRIDVADSGEAASGEIMVSEPHRSLTLGRRDRCVEGFLSTERMAIVAQTNVGTVVGVAKQIWAFQYDATLVTNGYSSR